MKKDDLRYVNAVTKLLIDDMKKYARRTGNKAISDTLENGIKRLEFLQNRCGQLQEENAQLQKNIIGLEAEIERLERNLQRAPKTYDYEGKLKEFIASNSDVLRIVQTRRYKGGGGHPDAGSFRDAARRLNLPVEVFYRNNIVTICKTGDEET